MKRTGSSLAPGSYASPESLQHLGRFLHAGRSRIGLSLREVGQILQERGVTLGRNGLHRIETGKAAPTIPQAAALAHFLHMETQAHRPGVQGWALNNQAVAVWYLGHPAPASRLLHLALRDVPPNELELPVYLWHNLAEVNRCLGHLPLARSAIREARAAWEDWPPPGTAAGQQRHRPTLGNIWNTGGNIFSDLYELTPAGPHAGRWWDQAHQAYDQARGIYLPHGLKQGSATVSLNFLTAWDPALADALACAAPVLAELPGRAWSVGIRPPGRCAAGPSGSRPGPGACRRPGSCRSRSVSPSPARRIAHRRRPICWRSSPGTKTMTEPPGSLEPSGPRRGFTGPGSPWQWSDSYEETPTWRETSTFHNLDDLLDRMVTVEGLTERVIRNLLERKSELAEMMTKAIPASPGTTH